MPGLTRVGDLESGHDGYEPVRLATGSPNVFINGRRAGRVGDVYEAHGGHRDVIASGSPSIFINGRPAARIGDSVSPGGSVPAGGLRGSSAAGDAGGTGTGVVSKGSETVATQIIDNVYLEISKIFSRRLTEILTQNPNRFYRTILNLWKIAEANAKRAQDSKDKIGWLILSALIRKWIGGKEGDKPTLFYVEWDWVLSYRRALFAYEDIISRLWNEKAKAQLAKKAIELLRDKDKIKFNFVDVERPGDVYFQFAPVFSYGIVDGLTAALGNFSFRAIAKGEIRRNPDGTFTIHVDEAYIVLFDNFDFKGWLQPLGAWDDQNLSGPAYNFHSVPLFNIFFTLFSRKYGYGLDFGVTTKPMKVYDQMEYVYDPASAQQPEETSETNQEWPE